MKALKSRKVIWCGMHPALLMVICSPVHAQDSQQRVVDVSADAAFKKIFDAWTASDASSSVPRLGSIPLDRPVDSFRYTSPFGTRIDPFRGNGSFHPGIDLAAPAGTPVHATAEARVARAAYASGYGNLVVLDHGGGIETRYGHLSQIAVKVGQLVHRGDVIGRVGSTGRSTGSHLHYEIRLSSQAIDPLPFMAPGDERLALNRAVGPRAGTATAMGGPLHSLPSNE
jgi:murein DD-endopeptidase MepM/ murein hydrolase activator NlpD